MSDEFRCSVASAGQAEPIAGTAPSAAEFLLVEYLGSWGRLAVEQSRLPERVKAHLADLTATRGTAVHLIRHHRGVPDGEGVRVFRAAADAEGFGVSTTVLTSVEDLVDLDLDDPAVFTSHEAPLWLVCTNGSRDRCCAEIGRPVTTALARRWPAETWEITHLGGHRFAGTLLALPSGHTLGRLTGDNAVEAVAQVAAGGVPVELSRGRAGRPGAEQVLELHLLAGGSPDVAVVAEPGPARRQSCGDDKVKATTRYVLTPRT